MPNLGYALRKARQSGIVPRAEIERYGSGPRLDLCQKITPFVDLAGTFESLIQSHAGPLLVVVGPDQAGDLVRSLLEQLEDQGGADESGRAGDEVNSRYA